MTEFKRLEQSDDFEWLQGKGGWFVYEAAERVAICVLNGVHPREAVDIANRQIGHGAYAVPARPY